MEGPFRAFESPADFEAFLAREERAFIFKHSTRCGISAGAEREFEEIVADRAAGPGSGPVPIYRVLVIEERAVSNAIASRLAIPHRSPQAILVEDGAAVWSA